MPPNPSYVLTSMSLEPVSRTYQYRKVMKPMLERKRRARINRCLDELKELMTGALQSEGENVAKLEKADILELTVRHLHNLRKQNSLFFRPDQMYTDRFWAGFRHCASEVSQFLSNFDHQTGVSLLRHINGCIQKIETSQCMKDHQAQAPQLVPHPGGQPQPTSSLHPSPLSLHQQQQQHLPVPAASSTVSSDILVINPFHYQQQYMQSPPTLNLPQDLTVVGLQIKKESNPACDQSSVWRPW